MRKHDGVRTDRYKLIHFYGKGGEQGAKENKYQMIPGTRENMMYNYLRQANYFTSDTATVDYYELYDLQADPHELNNIYGKPESKRIFKTLKKQLDDYRKSLRIDEY